MDTQPYDPFARGPFPVGVRTIHALDPARDRLFPVEIWYPATGSDALAHPGPHPLVIYSHSVAAHRRSATFLTTHLASHGYAVAALDHSEVVAPELHPRDGETRKERAARIDEVISSRVPDIRFLVDHLLDLASEVPIGVDAERLGLVGHSLGGWTVLATPEVEPRVRAVVALAPGGSTNPLPGILPLDLTFGWRRRVPALYLAAEDDTPVPPAQVHDVFDRAPEPKRMLVLRRADHQHFQDDVEATHEAVRAMSFDGEGAWIPRAMRPMAELCPGEHAHLFVRGLTLSHLDATLREDEAADRFLAGDLECELAVRGVEVLADRP